MRCPENNITNNNIDATSNLTDNFYICLIREKYFKDDSKFFSNAEAVDDILNKEYKGNIMKKREF